MQTAATASLRGEEERKEAALTLFNISFHRFFLFYLLLRLPVYSTPILPAPSAERERERDSRLHSAFSRLAFCFYPFFWLPVSCSRKGRRSCTDAYGDGMSERTLFFSLHSAIFLPSAERWSSVSDRELEFETRCSHKERAYSLALCYTLL